MSDVIFINDDYLFLNRGKKREFHLMKIFTQEFFFPNSQITKTYLSIKSNLYGIL